MAGQTGVGSVDVAAAMGTAMALACPGERVEIGSATVVACAAQAAETQASKRVAKGAVKRSVAMVNALDADPDGFRAQEADWARPLAFRVPLDEDYAEPPVALDGAQAAGCPQPLAFQAQAAECAQPLELRQEADWVPVLGHQVLAQPSEGPVEPPNARRFEGASKPAK